MKTHDSSTVAALLAQNGLAPDTRVELRRQVLRAIVPLALVLALGGLWAATAPLSGAVVAPAQRRSSFNRKTIQHQARHRALSSRATARRVSAGEPLVVVGDLRSKAELSVLQGASARSASASGAAAEAALEPRCQAALAMRQRSSIARERDFRRAPADAG
jgi:HlyD family secretion protein